ncbi:MAG TPA: DeoR family transcriptional regulator [Promineifilum sp.]|nr:DeoR family transcriptional regulator [Promineifilum sp.]
MDSKLPEQRQAQILEWLNERDFLVITELARQFSVSAMTIHRDVDRLVEEGRARKVHGGVMRIEGVDEVAARAQDRCAMCGKRPLRRTAWVITTERGERLNACCAHCGLLELHHIAGGRSALATDFLYGQMVNVYQATFVLGSAVTLCCVPSVLCFATRDDAERYQKGFGGNLMNFAQAMASIDEAHRSSHPDHH